MHVLYVWLCPFSVDFIFRVIHIKCKDILLTFKVLKVYKLLGFFNVCVHVCVVNSRRLQHDLTDTGHGAETVCRVLQWKCLVLYIHTNQTYYLNVFCAVIIANHRALTVQCLYEV